MGLSFWTFLSQASLCYTWLCHLSQRVWSTFPSSSRIFSKRSCKLTVSLDNQCHFTNLTDGSLHTTEMYYWIMISVTNLKKLLWFWYFFCSLKPLIYNLISILKQPRIHGFPHIWKVTVWCFNCITIEVMLWCCHEREFHDYYTPNMFHCNRWVKMWVIAGFIFVQMQKLYLPTCYLLLIQNPKVCYSDAIDLIHTQCISFIEVMEMWYLCNNPCCQR